MNINEIRTNYPRKYETRMIQKNNFRKHYLSQTRSDKTVNLNTAKRISTIDIYHMMNQAGKKEIKEQEEESKTDTNIIVKPDGSRVLVITMSVGGMETTMSLEISKPTAMQNDTSKQDTESDNNPSISNRQDELEVIDGITKV